ncbi:uncharacterized protein LOC119446835 [Dermacentor silvarum]|uniref:uncharacterized protein LOC119446835 n=1 Tax=Dermacentor silvarum TaxID=543639 RepID=UPI00189A432A|nr:uncharacterized protein LOC119446835 [Dermacentor silvarum]
MKKHRGLPPLLVVLFLGAGQTGHGSEVGEPVDPQNPGDVPERLQDTVHGVKMGVVNPECDNAKVNISVDFLDDPTVYVCFHPKAMYPLGTVAHGHSKQSCDTVPMDYRPRHYCMNSRIKYDSYLPTHEGHRPLWPVFGEYKYVPPQRWLHNIEHGAIVMLYHPCTHPYYVDTLRNIVTGCLRKHIITPYVHLSPERPLALVAWGCRYEMSTVDQEEVVAFIKEKALKGPEGSYPKEGQYTHFLLKTSTPPLGSDMNDTVICPGL